MININEKIHQSVAAVDRLSVCFGCQSQVNSVWYFIPLCTPNQISIKSKMNLQNEIYNKGRYTSKMHLLRKKHRLPVIQISNFRDQTTVTIRPNQKFRLSKLYFVDFLTTASLTVYINVILYLHCQDDPACRSS